MAIRVITAPPGKGKTLNMTRLAIELFESENRETLNEKIKRLKCKNLRIYKNNIYSNYPILLKKTKTLVKSIDGAGNEELTNHIYSNKLKFGDMNLSNVFCQNACFFIDEIAFNYDSMDYKDFPDAIAHFFQVHRHLDYKYIYTNSQSLSRIIKRVLCISEEYWNVISLWTFLPFVCRVKFKVTYDIETSKKEENIVNKESRVVVKWFFKKRVFEAYDSKYLKVLKSIGKTYNKGTYDSLQMSKEEILNNFIMSKEDKEKLNKLEF